MHIFRYNIPNFKKFNNYRNILVPLNEDEKINMINKFQCIMANEKIFINPDYKDLLKKYLKDDLLK